MLLRVKIVTSDFKKFYVTISYHELFPDQVETQASVIENVDIKLQLKERMLSWLTIYKVLYIYSKPA